MTFGKDIDIRTKYVLHHMYDIADATNKALENNDDVEYVVLKDNIIIYRPLDWLRIIKYVYENMEEDDSKVMELYYFQNTLWAEAMAIMNIDRSTFYKRVRNVTSLVEIAAAQVGLIELIK